MNQLCKQSLQCEGLSSHVWLCWGGNTWLKSAWSEVIESGKHGRGRGKQHCWGEGSARGQFQWRAMARRLRREAILLARTQWVMALEPPVVRELLSQGERRECGGWAWRWCICWNDEV